MITILLRTLLIYLFITLILRIMGKRQVGELEVTELVSALMLSELATMSISDTNIPLMQVFLPVSIIVTLEVILSFGITRLPIMKKLFEAKPSFLISKGKLDRDEMGRMRITVEELLGQLRQKGFSHVEDVEYAILEQNGQISVIAKQENQPLTPKDVQISVKEKGIDHPLVVDGQIYYKSAAKIGYTEKDVLREVRKCGCRLDEIFLLAIDDAGNTTLTRKKRKGRKK